MPHPAKEVRMIQNRIFGDDLEVVWVVVTIMVTEEASVVMVALAASVVVVAGLVTVGCL